VLVSDGDALADIVPDSIVFGFLVFIVQEEDADVAILHLHRSLGVGLFEVRDAYAAKGQAIHAGKYDLKITQIR
jgi:hypothetical protein